MEQGGAEWKWWEKEGGIGWNMVEYGEVLRGNLEAILWNSIEEDGAW